MFSRIFSSRTKAAAIIALLASSLLAPVAASAAGVVPSNCGSTVALPGTCDTNGVFTFTPGFTDTAILGSPWSTIFVGNAAITSLTIPNTVTEIGTGAFAGMSSLVNLTLPTSLTVLRENSFQGATALKSLTIPDSVWLIGSESFSGAPLETLVLGNNVQIIGFGVFSGMSSLLSLTIPESVTTIGASAFAGMTNLTSLTFAPGTKPLTIGNYAFAGASALTSLIVPNRVTSIGDYAFDSAFALRELNIPKSVTRIGARAFHYARALEKLTFEDQSDEWLSQSHPEGEYLSIGISAFSTQNSQLKSLTIPSSVTSIGDSAFFSDDTSKLSRLIIKPRIANKTLSIGEETFRFASWNLIECVTQGAPGQAALINLDRGRGDLPSFASYPECVPEQTTDSGSGSTTPTETYVPTETYIPTETYVPPVTEDVDLRVSYHRAVFFAKGKASLNLNSKTSIQSFAKTFAKATAVKILVTSYRVGATSNKKEVALARARGAAVVAYFKARHIAATYQLLPSIRVKTAALASRVAIAVSAVLKVSRAKS